MLWSWKKQRCRDGVMSDFVSWCRHLLVFIYIPLIEMIFPLVPLIFLIMGQSTNHSLRRARYFTHAHAHADNAPRPRRPAPPCTHVYVYVYNRMLWRRSVSAREKPTIYRRNLRREKNDRLVSVHTSIDCGEVWCKNQR